MNSAHTVFILPGWQGSGAAHWQSLWEQHGAQGVNNATFTATGQTPLHFVRVQQHDWQRPLRGDWCARLEEMVVNLNSDMGAGTDIGMGRGVNSHFAATNVLLNSEQTIDIPRRESAYFYNQNPPTITLVAHSLGCHLVAAWASVSKNTHAIAGALLVAPPDLSQADLPEALHSWRKTNASSSVNGALPFSLPFPATCVISSNDPFASLAAGRAMAQRWGARCVAAGALGHINSDSGLGDWSQGRALLSGLCGSS